MIDKAAQLLAARRVPQTNRPVGAAGSQRLAVRRKGQAAHFAVVPLQGANFAAGRRVPEADEAIIAGGGDQLAVAGVNQGVDRSRMAKAQGAQTSDGSLRQRLVVGTGGWSRAKEQGRRQ